MRPIKDLLRRFNNCGLRRILLPKHLYQGAQGFFAVLLREAGQSPTGYINTALRPSSAFTSATSSVRHDIDLKSNKWLIA